jgi:hypothetical protein
VIAVILSAVDEFFGFLIEVDGRIGKTKEDRIGVSGEGEAFSVDSRGDGSSEDGLIETWIPSELIVGTSQFLGPKRNQQMIGSLQKRRNDPHAMGIIPKLLVPVAKDAEHNQINPRWI